MKKIDMIDMIEKNKDYIDIIIQHLCPELIDDSNNFLNKHGRYLDNKTSLYKCKESPVYFLNYLAKKNNKNQEKIGELREEIDNLYELLDDIRYKIKKKADKK